MSLKAPVLLEVNTDKSYKKKLHMDGCLLLSHRLLYQVLNNGYPLDLDTNSVDTDKVSKLKFSLLENLKVIWREVYNIIVSVSLVNSLMEHQLVS